MSSSSSSSSSSAAKPKFGLKQSYLAGLATYGSLELGRMFVFGRADPTSIPIIAAAVVVSQVMYGKGGVSGALEFGESLIAYGSGAAAMAFTSAGSLTTLMNAPQNYLFEMAVGAGLVFVALMVAPEIYKILNNPKTSGSSSSS